MVLVALSIILLMFYTASWEKNGHVMGGSSL